MFGDEQSAWPNCSTSSCTTTSSCSFNQAWEKMLFLCTKEFMKRRSNICTKDRQRCRSPAPRGNSASTSRVQNKKTGRSPSGKDDRPLCFRHKNGACDRGKECDFWHPPPHLGFKDNQCRMGKECPLVHSQKRFRSLTRRSRGTFLRKVQALLPLMQEKNNLGSLSVEEVDETGTDQ